MSYEDGICEVCKKPVIAQVRYFDQSPYVDGRFYSYMCWTCANVPKVYPRDGESFIRVGKDGIRPKLVHTVAEMQADGWSKEEASFALKIVSAKIKQMPIALVSQFGNVKFEMSKLS